MFRAVVFGVASSVLAAACALVDPPPLAGTFPMEAEVRNRSRGAVEFIVRRAPGGALPGGAPIIGSARPASVPPGITPMTFHLPLDGNWLIDIPGWGEIEGKDFGSFLALQCRPLLIEFEADGAWGWPGCP